MRIFTLILSAVVIGIVLAGAACSLFRPGCIIQAKVADAVTEAIVTNLQCTNFDAVKADVNAALDRIKLCPAATGPIANAFCPMVAGAVVGIIGEKAIPAAWGCSAAAAKEAVTSFLVDACKKIPVEAN